MRGKTPTLSGLAIVLLLGVIIGAGLQDEAITAWTSDSPASPVSGVDHPAEHAAASASGAISASTSAVATPHSSTPTAVQPVPTTVAASTAPDLSEARAEYERLNHLQRCAYAHGRASPRSQESLDRHMRQWLPPEWAERERRGLAEAVSRVLETCPLIAEGEEAKGPSAKELERARRRAALAGDIEARMAQIALDFDHEPTARDIEALRDHLYDAVLSGDPARIARIGPFIRYLESPDDGDFLWGYRDVIWNRVACELGLACTAGSPMMDRICLRDSAACGATDYLDYLHLTQGPVFVPLIEAQSRELVERIRAGQIAGLFDSQPPPPPGDG